MSKKNGPEPFFRPSRGLWYVQYKGRQYNLGPDKEQARVRCHQILGGSIPSRTQALTNTGPLACEVIDLFLARCTKHRPGRTAEWYQKHLQSFLDSLPDDLAATLPASEVKPYHVENWVDANAEPAPGRRAWGPNHRRGAIIAVQAAFNWAQRKGHIPMSPLRGVEKPPAKRREQVLTPAEFAGLLGRVKDDCFRDVLEFCWETGSRVQEVRLIEGRHVRLDRGRVELPPPEAKGKKRWRFIYLTPRAEAILERLVQGHGQGILFRNTRGTQWKAQNFNNRFCRLQHRLGREELKRQGFTLDPDEVRVFAASLPKTKVVNDREVPKSEKDLLREARKKLTTKAADKIGTKYALTTIRHSFATRLLEAGVDHLTVSTLLGHKDGSLVLSRTYSHIGEKTDYLREELVRASAGRAEGGAGTA